MAAVSSFVALGAAALAAGATVYSSQQSSKSAKAAMNANAANIGDTNALNYQTWQESKGIGSNGQPINTWLPRYLTTTGTVGKTASRYRLADTPNDPLQGGSIEQSARDQAARDAAAAAPAAPGAKKSAGKLANLIDPLGLAVGDKPTVKSIIDPLGLFCWVAREIYGTTTPKWMEFRDWLLNEGPEHLRAAYAQHGEQFAERVKIDPVLRAEVHSLMDDIFEKEIA